MIEYELIAAFDEYTGNFEREMTAWVFGAQDEYKHYEYDRPHAESMLWAHDPEEEEGALELFPHEEYGLVWQDITVFDHSNHTGAIRWKFSRQPTTHELELIVEAIKGYPEDSWKKSGNLVGLKLIEITRTETETILYDRG